MTKGNTSTLFSPDDTIQTPVGGTAVKRTLASKFTPATAARPSLARKSVLPDFSPTATMTESLNKLAKETAERLEKSFNEMGYNAEDRSAAMERLLQKYQDISEEVVAFHQNEVEQFRADIENMTRTIFKTAKSLGIDPDHDLLEEAQAMTLRDGLMALRASYVKLHEAAAIASQDIRESSALIADAYSILGQEMEPSWRDVESDLSDERRKMFRKKMGEMESQVESRMSAMIKCLLNCRSLMAEMRWEPETDLDKRIAGSLMISPDGTAQMVSKNRTESCVGLQSQALAEVSQRLGELQRVKETRIQKIRALSEQISHLWTILDISEEYSNIFSAQIPEMGMSEATIELGKHELARLREMKAQKMGQLIENSRIKIAQHWKSLGYPQEMRETFPEFFVENKQDFDDKLLQAHERYYEILEQQMEKARPLLKLIERREAVVEERTTYEVMLHDPNRWNHRGKKLTEQLMEEEKMAKRIKQLPKLEENIQRKLDEFEESSGYAFRFEGQVYMDRMVDQEQQWLDHKEALASAKQKKKGEDPNVHKRPLRGTRHNHNVKAQSNDYSKPEQGKSRNLPRQASDRFRN